jgi:hypothetical protein
MSEYVTGFSTVDGIKKYDYNALANKPDPGASFITYTASGEIITATDAAKRGFDALNIYGKTTQTGTPTPDNPVELVSVGNGGSVSVTVCGKNLLPFATIGNTYTTGGITVTFDSDGCVANGTPTVDYVIVKTIANLALPVGTYYISGGANGKFYAQVIITKNGVKSYYINKAFTIDGTETRVEVSLQTGPAASTGTLSSYRIYPMLVIGSTAPTKYEPYKGQTLAVETPNGLPGIPVASGGNYTDSNGQQWICDEIDFDRGVYVKRIEKYSFAVADMDGSESYPGWRNAGIAKYYPDANSYLARYGAVSMCNIDGNSRGNVHINTTSGTDVIMIPNPNGMAQSDWKSQYPDLVFELIVSIPTPEEIPLSEEELAAYTALRMYREHTTVSNDAGAYMYLEYAIDTKKYIDGLMTGSILPARVE